jgi:hypothetical protein
MSDEHGAPERAQLIYNDINSRTSKYDDFEETQLEQSRQYFDLATPELRTRPFDVLTSLVGLEIPSELQHSFSGRLDEILSIFPDSTRVYRVRPHLMHWESHIIRRPGEPKPQVPLDEIVKLFNKATSESHAFDITYRGFFVASDGTIAFQGYGQTEDLRSRLREALPFSSPRQNETGHISVARILDPLGSETFHRLLDMRRAAEDDVVGVLPVHEVKLVSERRWYMEDYEIVTATQLVC